MGARLRSWWHLKTIRFVLIILVVVILLIIIGYRFDWTGFNGYNEVTITQTISGTNAGTVTKTEKYQPGKGLWDWLQLLGILAIPVVVGFGAAWYTARQSHDREIMLDNQRETALQTYIDKIPVYKLAEPELAGTKEQIILRARTLALLPSMDANRKRTLLQFLYELHLICIPDRVHPKYPIIKLSTADLSGANLTNLNLEEADLAQSNLSRANLRGAILTKANLQGAILDNADLSQANLRDATGIDTRELERKAKLLQGAIMPDGFIHP